MPASWRVATEILDNDGQMGHSSRLKTPTIQYIRIASAMAAILAFNPVWITLGPIVVINVGLLCSYLLYQLWGQKRLRREYEGAKTQGSQFLSTGTREWWLWTTDPIVRLFVRLRIGPNLITMIGFCIAAASGVLYARGSFGYAGWAMIFGASFDMFDGRVARITQRSSRSGAFFDAVMDRFSEGACLLGLALFFRDGWMLPVVIAALVGSMLVSYTRARGEGIGVDCKVGWMQRPERIVSLGVASVFDPIMTMVLHRWWAAPPPVLLIVAVAFIAVMTNATAIYRMIFIMNALDTEDRRGKESIPQLITKLATPSGREELWDRARYGYDRRRAAFSHVVLFLVGGVTPGLIETLARRGDLPHISEHLLARGGLSQATSVFPSTMGPASTPFVTGAFPGTCDIPGARWFDRTIPPSRVITMNRFRDYLGWGAYAMDHDLAGPVRTIFEYSRQAVNIFGILNRGCGLIRDPAFFRMAGRFHRARRGHDAIEAQEAAFGWFTSAVARETDFVLYAFPPLECAGGTPATIEIACQALIRIDGDIGRAAEVLRRQGMYDETALLLAGSYGQAEGVRRFDLESFLARRLRVCTPGRGLKDWHEADVIALPSGTSMAHLYFNGGGDWSARSFFEDVERRGLVGSLLEQDGVDLLAGRSVEGGVVVQSRRGRAHLHEDADGRLTCLLKGGDPFGYGHLPQVMDAAEALRQSFDTAYPDGILQVLQLFRSRRAGDLVLSTEADVVLLSGGEEEGAAATSGSLSRAHIIVPVLSNTALPSSPFRTADLFPMVIEMLGIEPVHRMDGVVPFEMKAGERSRAASEDHPSP